MVIINFFWVSMHFITTKTECFKGFEEAMTWVARFQHIFIWEIGIQNSILIQNMWLIVLSTLWAPVIGDLEFGNDMRGQYRFTWFCLRFLYFLFVFVHHNSFIKSLLRTRTLACLCILMCKNLVSNSETTRLGMVRSTSFCTRAVYLFL